MRKNDSVVLRQPSPLQSAQHHDPSYPVPIVIQPPPTPAPRLLLFDSGLGGLSIASEIRTVLPTARLTYVADNRHFPYGTLSEEALVDRVTHLFPWLLAQYQPDIIVIACNSASTLVLDRLRAIDQRPIIGVVPAIKPAALHSRTQCIGLLATPGTVQRAYTQRLIQEFAAHCQVIRVGSHELVTLAEQKLQGQPTSLSTLNRILAPFNSATTLDTLVLGCTHFPLLRNDILQCLRPGISLIDSGSAIARRALHLWQALSPAMTRSTERSDAPGDHFLYTSTQQISGTLGAFLADQGFTHHSCIGR